MIFWIGVSGDIVGGETVFIFFTAAAATAFVPCFGFGFGYCLGFFLEMAAGGASFFLFLGGRASSSIKSTPRRLFPFAFHT